MNQVFNFNPSQLQNPPSGVTGVSLAGQFNNWNGEAMTGPDGNGNYTITKSLTVGIYGYKFIVSTASGDTWFFDQNGLKGVTIDGVDNSYVDVPDITTQQAFQLIVGASGYGADVQDYSGMSNPPNGGNGGSIIANITNASPSPKLIVPAKSLRVGDVIRLTARARYQIPTQGASGDPLYLSLCNQTFNKALSPNAWTGLGVLCGASFNPTPAAASGDLGGIVQMQSTMTLLQMDNEGDVNLIFLDFQALAITADNQFKAGGYSAKFSPGTQSDQNGFGTGWLNNQDNAFDILALWGGNHSNGIHGTFAMLEIIRGPNNITVH